MSEKQRQAPLFRSLRRLRTALWWRRVARGLVRSLWLALLVPTVLMAGHLWLGWQVRWQLWIYPALLVGLLSTLWSTRPIGLQKMVRRLDNRLGLRARLATAFEVSHGPDQAAHDENPVVWRLLREAVTITIRLRHRVRTWNLGLWLEVQTLLAIAALLGGMFVLGALNPRVPNAQPLDLPPAWREPTADEVIPSSPTLFPPPFSSEAPSQALNESPTKEDLQALADALRDQAVTRAIAEAIDRGDLQAAAQGLRRLAEQLDDLSAETRRELGDALGEAAEQMGADAPSLTEPLEAGSQALEREALGQASQALEDLAEALDALEDAPQAAAQAQAESDGEPGDGAQPEEGASSDSSQSGGTGGDGAGEGEAGNAEQPTEAERLAIEGQPLELESDPDLKERVLQPAEPDAQAGDERASESPFSRQPLNATTGDLGPDPLTFPWEKRDVIRRYFTP